MPVGLGMHRHILRQPQACVSLCFILTLFTSATGVTRRAAGPNQFVYTSMQTPTISYTHMHIHIYIYHIL